MDWAARCPLLDDALLFNYLGGQAGSCAIVPIQADFTTHTYINGSSERAYDFAFQALRMVSSATDDINTGNMYIQRQFADWILAQEKQRNYPDFGPKCSGYSLELLSNMPMLAEQYENGLGKYQFFARINYKEESPYA